VILILILGCGFDLAATELEKVLSRVGHMAKTLYRRVIDYDLAMRDHVRTVKQGYIAGGKEVDKQLMFS
jgi:hypothetical protein